MDRRLFLNIVICHCSIILELFAREYQTLLVSRNALFILDFGLDVGNRITRFDFDRNRLASQSFDKDLHFFLCREFFFLGKTHGGNANPTSLAPMDSDICNHRHTFVLYVRSVRVIPVAPRVFHAAQKNSKLIVQ